MKKKTWNIAIGGEAGQGLVTIGELLAKLLARTGYEICVTQSYESRVRGGHNIFYIRTGTGVVESPREEIDILLALNEETVSIHLESVAGAGVILAGKSVGISDKRILNVPYEDLSEDRYRNIAALGVVSSLLGLKRAMARTLLEQRFSKKHPELVDGNLETIDKAYDWAEDHRVKSMSLPAAGKAGKRIVINGNQAIATGAVSAGVRFCSFYPMTPATSIPLTLIEMAGRMGLVVEQVEDEISAVNMAIGASFAGAPAMAATSGGGFALMVEGISLAGMTETPIVVAVAQRPGPATGLPTRTEQADLEFVLRSGHGEFPRAIFAPGTIEECFDLTRRAFFLAEDYQTPVFILTDQYLADSLRAVAPFDLGELDFLKPGMGSPPAKGSYKRHKVTESGVSPRLIPGLTEHLVVTDSDEHTEDGHLTEDLEVRVRQVKKRLKKGEGMLKEVLSPEYEGGEGPELLLVSWGSSRGAVREAARILNDRSGDVATLHFSQVWPLVPDQFLERLKKAGRVVSVEGNATGQLARMIAGETGWIIKEKISRFDGLPFTPEYIIRELEGPAGKKSTKGSRG